MEEKHCTKFLSNDILYIFVDYIVSEIVMKIPQPVDTNYPWLGGAGV